MNLDRPSGSLLPSPPRRSGKAGTGNDGTGNDGTGNPRRRRRADWGQRIARVLCVVFAIVGALPLAASVLVRSDFAHRWAAAKTETLARGFGISAKYDLDLRLWPLSVALRNVQVDASDGGTPFAVVRSVRVRPKLFALFAGKLMLDQIDVEEPRLRVVLKHGELANLALTLPPSDKKDEPTKPFRSPFAVASISGGLIDLTVDDARGTVGDLDLDVTAEDVRVSGGIASSFEVALHAERGALETGTFSADASAPGTHTDVLCSIDARARIEPTSILVRHLEALGAADLTADDGAAASCEQDASSPGRVEIALSHFLATLPTTPGGKPELAGHARVRAPIALGSRFAATPTLSGWAGVDVDVRFADDTPIPEVSGHIDGREVAFGHFHLLESLDVDVSEAKDKVTVPRARINIASGVTNLSDVVIDLKTMRLVHASVENHDVSFAALMRELGNSPHPHVEWELRDVRVPELAGSLVPMKLDGEVIAKTENFIVYNAPVDEPTHKRVIGVTSALVNMHLHITDDALQFQAIHVVTPHSVLDASIVSLGYSEDLLVDVPRAQVGLEDITPLSTTAIGGHALVSVKLTGKFGDPELVGEGHIDDFSLGDIPFGNVLEVHAQLENVRTLILTNVHAQKNKSLYEMPSAKLDFSGNAGLDMDAEARSSSLGLRDFFALFHMDDDPRFASFDGDMAPRARIHLALGGPEDVCGAGFIDVRAQVHAQKISLYGETFDDGDVDLEYRSLDQPAGLAGVDVDVRALTLHRLHPAGQPAIGQILGSASIHRGGLLRGTITVDGMPLSRLAALKSFGGRLEGAASGVLDISGNIASPEMRADVDLTPLRARRATFGPSHLHLAARLADTSDIVGYTPRCHLPIGKAYDKVAAAAAPLLGSAVLDGQLFGGQIELTKASISSQLTAPHGHTADPEVSGVVAFHKLDLGALLDATRKAPEESANDADADESQRAAADQDRASGTLSGLLVVEQLPLDDPGQMRARFAPTELSVKSSGGTLALRTRGQAKALLVVDHDRVVIPPMTFDLAAAGGFNGSFAVKGQVDALTHGGQLGVVAELAPIDLSLLSGLVPKVERAGGMLGGQLRATGSFGAPNLDGKITLHNGDFTINGLPSAVSDVELVIGADTRAIKIEHATAHFAGGDLTASGKIPLKGLAFGDGDLHLDAKSVHLSPAEGISATLDANLGIAFSAASSFTGNKTLPRVTGDVLVTSFEYSRPVNLLSDVGGLSVHRKPQTVKTYDPTQDALTLDVRVRSKVPLRIKNNLAELELAVGAPGGTNELVISGTNQRIGLRGELRALPGGHFRLFANEFEIRQSAIRFDDPTRIAPNVDVTAFTEYRRYTDSSSAAGSSSTDAPGAISSNGSGRAGGASWRITVHAYGDPDDLKVDMTSDPPLSQDDIFLLLTIGLTRSEVDQAQGSSIGASLAFEAVGTATGADRAVKTVVPVIDDFRFGSAYSTKTYRSEPQVTVGKAITPNIRASVTAGLAEDEELRSDIEFRLSRQYSVLASYDNINDVSSASIGNVGADFRWRLEFE